MTRLILYVLSFIVMLVSVVGQHITAQADTHPSRVFVTAYPCNTVYNASNENTQPLLGGPGEPIIELHDETTTSDIVRPLKPAIHITQTATKKVQFHFDVLPGNYDMFLSFPKAGACGKDGHLITLAHKNRHLVVATCHCVTDWHARAAIAGTLPFSGLSVDVWHFNKPQKCRVKIPPLSPETEREEISHAVIDDGAFYGEFGGTGDQDNQIAIIMSGALYSGATILLTTTPKAHLAPWFVPYIVKNITSGMVQAAMMESSSRFVCASGF